MNVVDVVSVRLYFDDIPDMARGRIASGIADTDAPAPTLKMSPPFVGSPLLNEERLVADRIPFAAGR
jgi:hypothetical protein